MKFRKTILLTPILLLACNVIMGIPTPTPARRTPTPTNTPRSFTSTPSPTPSSTPIPTAPVLDLADQAAAMLPGFAGDIDALQPATQYAIDARVSFDPDLFQASIEGEARIFFTNPLDESLEDFALMLWPNDEQYLAEMQAGPVHIGGSQIGSHLDAQELVLRFMLPESLAPGASLSLSLPFHIQAYGPITSLNPYRFGITEGVLIAPSFYPMVPRFVDGDWQTDDPPSAGDTTNSDIAFFDVRITTPTTLELAASGVEIERLEHDDGTRTQRFVTGPMRDFAFALGPFERSTRTADDITLVSWVLPEHSGDAETMLRAAALQVQTLNRLIGPYPYPELDLVDAPEAFGGIEYPGLVYIGTVGTYWLVEPTVHEVAHQWFYALVGSDQLIEPWMDEAAAMYAEVLYYEAAGRVGLATSLLDGFRFQVRDHPRSSTPIGLPVDTYASDWDYSTFVYLKGALFYEALRQRLGDDIFFSFLSGYFSSYRYGFAEAEDFHAAAEQACDCELDDLFNLWVYLGGPVFQP
ncbi:MAG TPA: M1 family metallopeptidase [Anaerolineae bacterium]|nr:M1 family metallopeptidase [Anaerolineae bacterium]